MPTKRPRVLIEDWLPGAELGIESRREAAPIPGQFPKLKTLHVWWARRPLVASAGAVLASLMPAWSQVLADAFPDAPELQSDDSYRAWFMRLCGVLGDPVGAKVALARANEVGLRLADGGYGYKPAFKNSPSPGDVALLHRLFQTTWLSVPTVIDPTAGGGSIPYEAARYGLVSTANELNPVAAAVLRCGVELPARFGRQLGPEIEHWGRVLVERVRVRLDAFFALEDLTERVVGYIFARTVACPRTGKPVPLSPNWWLSKGKGGTAVRMITERDGRELDTCEFEIVSGKDIDFDPSNGTVAMGTGISPWDGLTIDGDHIKAEAQAGRMGAHLYAVAIRTSQGRGFRSPTRTDIDAIAAADVELQECLPQWLASDVVPNEVLPPGLKTPEPLRYGITLWRDMFSPRQLLTGVPDNQGLADVCST